MLRFYTPKIERLIEKLKEYYRTYQDYDVIWEYPFEDDGYITPKDGGFPIPKSVKLEITFSGIKD